MYKQYVRSRTLKQEHIFGKVWINEKNNNDPQSK